jgi:MFS superfamily sulfate permease-like transporter
VYTGFKLVSPAHLRELRDFGWGAIGIYGVTLAGVVAQDLLTGVLIGLGLSALRLLVTLGSFEIETKEQQSNERLDVTFRGALTFVGLPRLAATLESLPNAQDIHLHVDQLRYIDHACLVAIGDFERQARQRGQSVTIDWTDLDARSEKQLPPAAADVRQLQPST